MIKAKRLMVSLLDPHLYLITRRLFSDAIPVQNPDEQYLVQQRKLSELILQGRIYVNKIHKLAVLMNYESKGIAITAPRRTGKSLTLSSLHMVKVIGLSDFIELLKMKKPDSDAHRAALGLEQYLIQQYGKVRYESFYGLPQPVAILTPALASTQQKWVRNIVRAYQNSYDDLLQIHLELGQQGKVKHRKAMLKKYKALIKQKSNQLQFLSGKGSLFMIDEYDSIFMDPSSSQETKQLARREINDIMSFLKERHCIVAGVYHPKTIGFNLSSVNSYKHHSQLVDPNALAFTKKEVTQFFQQDFNEAIASLSIEKRRELIKEIKKCFIFDGDEQIKMEINKTQQTKLVERENSHPTIPYNQTFNEELLSKYVIDLMFYMHDGFNLNFKKVPHSKDYIISPQVVVSILDRIKKSQKPFVDWDDYIDSAMHSQVKAMFNSKNYIKLKPEAKQFLAKILKQGFDIVPYSSLYPQLHENQLLPPQSVLLQQGLLSIDKLFQDKDSVYKALLRIPNHGIKKFLIELKKQISQTIGLLVKSLFEDLKEKEDQQRFQDLRELFHSINTQVFNFVADNIGDHRLTEKNYNIYFVEFLNSVKSKQFKDIEIVKELQVDNQEKVEAAEQAGQEICHRDILEPDITIKNKQKGLWGAIEILRNPNKTKINQRRTKYDKLQRNYTTVVILAFDNEFKQLLQFHAFTPKRSKPDESS